MSFRFLPDDPVASIKLRPGQTVMVDPSARRGGSCLEVLEGVARVYCPCEETEGMTLAFLQEGDQVRTDRLCSEGICVEALTPLCFRSDADPHEGVGFDSVNEWTLQLLRLRQIHNGVFVKLNKATIHMLNWVCILYVCVFVCGLPLSFPCM